jgi:hypothetical protein
MTVFDLVFIAVFLSTATFFILALWALVRGRFHKAGRIAVWLGAFHAVYMGTLISVSIMTPQRVLGMGEDRCFDDWCLAVEQCSFAHSLGQGADAASAHGTFHVLHLRVSSRARRISQSAPDTRVYLVDSQGRRYDPSSKGQRAYDATHGESKPLSAMLGPSESFSTTRIFDLPPDARDVGLVVFYGEGPGWFIIGDSQSLFHKRTVIRLPSTSDGDPIGKNLSMQALETDGSRLVADSATEEGRQDSRNTRRGRGGSLRIASA